MDWLFSCVPITTGRDGTVTYMAFRWRIWVSCPVPQGWAPAEQRRLKKEPANRGSRVP